jgi:hypothetical protein
MSGFLEIENLNVTLGRGGPRLLRDVSLTRRSGKRCMGWSANPAPASR